MTPSRGTRPSKLYYSGKFVSMLEDSSLWNLMTDGKIDDKEVHGSQKKILAIGLHGSTCIFIIFASRPAKPSQVNISVGFSVYAARRQKS